MKTLQNLYPQDKKNSQDAQPDGLGSDEEDLITKAFSLQDHVLVQYRGWYVVDVTIPVHLGITEIADRAFSHTGISALIMPEGVQKIGKESFSHCYNLTEVHIPASVSSIDWGAFAGGNHLSEIQVAADNPAYTSVDGVLFDKALTTLMQYPAGKKDEVYTIPNTVTHIAPHAFSDCVHLIKVVIPETVTFIGEKAFFYCARLKDLLIPLSVRIIEKNAFQYCLHLTHVILSKRMKVGEEAFPSNVSVVYLK
jgi:hypothetical protein